MADLFHEIRLAAEDLPLLPTPTCKVLGIAMFMVKIWYLTGKFAQWEFGGTTP